MQKPNLVIINLKNHIYELWNIVIYYNNEVKEEFISQKEFISKTTFQLGHFVIDFSIINNTELDKILIGYVKGKLNIDLYKDNRIIECFDVYKNIRIQKHGIQMCISEV
jgi:hypothetical protein